MKVDHLLIVYAALNAILYSALLPLCEGFDEPFHFGYVQQLANGQGFPDPRSARLSREVSEAILRAPASHAVKANLPEVVTYHEFFSWATERRSQAHQSLHDIPERDRWQPSNFLNYEALQAPLAYMVLAIPERLLAAFPLPSRVLNLRIVAALAGSFLLYAGASSLGSQLGIGEPYRRIALFCVLSSQMTWATLAHVANDWLAVPLAIWTLVFMIRCASSPTTGNLAIASLVLCAGLLTKAYFLALVPILFAICVVRRGLWGLVVPTAVIASVAMPWYVRNYRLYDSISGRQEARAGIGVSAVLRAAPALDWPKVAEDSARSALWTANNTFRTFAPKTLNIVILVCAAALLLWAFSRHALGEWVTVAYCSAFLFALAYAGVAANIFTRGESSMPAPWYAQVLVTPILILSLLGTARWRRVGRVLAIVLPLIFGYMLVVTYVFKLIPLYAGYEGRSSVHSIAVLYLTQFDALSANLGSVALGPVWLIFGLTIAVIILIVAQEVLLIRGLPCSPWSLALRCCEDSGPTYRSSPLRCPPGRS
jgi:hypothetical protein